jgi:hypothetical protein
MRCRRPALAASAVAVAALSLLAAGCGGGGGAPGVASVATSTTTTTTGAATSAQGGLVAFANCMRTNGLPNFPEPQRIGGNIKLTIHALGASNPQLQAAMHACSHLLPNGGPGQQETAQQLRTRLADGLSFARCMRGHGVARFPDPTAQGQLTVEMVQAQGINVHSPAVLQAVEACLPASHGLLTPAKVAEALNNANG